MQLPAFNSVTGDTDIDSNGDVFRLIPRRKDSIVIWGKKVKKLKKLELSSEFFHLKKDSIQKGLYYFSNLHGILLFHPLNL